MVLMVFDGKLHNFEVTLHIKSSVPPVAQPARKIPFHIRRKIAALKQLKNDDVIEKVEGPTRNWISPLVVIPKHDGTVHLCGEMRMERERHPSLIVNDLMHALNGAKYFSKLDLRSGYHQLLLTEESQYIATFATYK